MIYQKYNERLYTKFENADKIYANQIFKKIGELTNVKVYKTQEHLRLVPITGWQNIEKNSEWGGEWENIWIKGNVVVPKEAEGKKLYAVAKTGAREILYFKNGKPSGIFNTQSDFIGGDHGAQLITSYGKTGDEFELAFECYAGHFVAGCGPYDSYGKDEPGKNEFNHHYESIDLCIMDEELKDLVFDLKALLQMVKRLPENDFLKREAANLLEEIFPDFVLFSSHYNDDILKTSIQKCLKKTTAFFASNKGSERSRGKVGLIGHSHMDTAWLWPVSETIRKCARTYSNALYLMEQYPEYKFIQSSVLHLDWMRRYYPDIFEGIAKMTKAGRYEPNGGVWVECDCNITSGEMMIRQFLKGQLYTRKYLNYTADCFWLPDTFGYNAAIPQIMNGCEVKYFYTTKISWNDLNDFPLDTFNWKGIDGSEVLTHFNLTHTFPDVENVLRAVNSIKVKQVTDSHLLALGFGDGGGGPTYGMLEDARRSHDIKGLPETEYTTISQFMKDLEKDSTNIPLYDGELYLELHRGTLTQMHDIKRNNRKAEFALHNMEFLNVLSNKKKNECSDELCEILLKNQFHDILPGTSITRVNIEARKEVTELISQLKKITCNYMEKLTDDKKDKVTVFNTLGFERNDDIYLEDVNGIIKDASNQYITDIKDRKYLVVGDITIPCACAKTLTIVNETPGTCSSFKYDGKTLKTPYAEIIFDECGYIESFVDKQSGRELRRNGGEPLNVFLMGEDVPQYWDNWDIDSDLKLKLELQKGFKGREVVADGKLQMRLRSTYSIGNYSTLKQDIIVYKNSPRVDFHTVVDWNDKHSFLKVGFDVDISAKFTKNEIQFGHIDRPTTRNNCLEAAKFEVCNYKWTDISESRFGVAILNDCKYGISVEGSDMRLSLHKGGCHPDVTGDKGIHEMTYSLLPHTDSMNVNNVIKPAYTLNVPIIYTLGELNKPIDKLFEVKADNVICETVKPAELVENAYILRLYEAERCKTFTEVILDNKVKKAYLTNMLEDIKEELPITDGKILLSFRPFEIKTVLLVK